MPLSSAEFLSPVVSTHPSHAGGLHGLGIQYPGAWLGIATDTYAEPFAQHRADALPGAIQAPQSEVIVDGLLTNDKFCFTRHDRLKLRPPRRGYPSRENASRGGDRETKLDRSSHHEGSQRRRSALGSGISAPAPVGGSGAAGGPDGGGE